jgi:hypothetical protein
MRFLRFAALGAAMLGLTGCSSAPATAPMSTYLLGEKVQLGKLSYAFFETQWLTQLGDGPTARVPQHRFFLIRFSATNSGSSDANIPNMTIRDDKGKEYEEVSDGSGVPQWAGYLRMAKPADTVQGNLVFDAPAAHYKLKISDENGTKFALIDIPLSYVNETPEVITPGDKKQ